MAELNIGATFQNVVKTIQLNRLVDGSIHLNDPIYMTQVLMEDQHDPM